MVRNSAVIAVFAVLALVVVPAALGALGGSGNVTDVVQLSTTTSSIPALTSAASGASAIPVASSVAFTMTNSGSNVDTLLRYAWGTPAYFGANPASTSITIRGSPHAIGDLVWFRQESLTAAGVATTSASFSPLIVKSDSAVRTASFSSSGNACTAWTGAAAGGFSATAAGTFTHQYHLAGSPVNDAPATSDVFHYCLDTVNQQVYLAKSASFTGATSIQSYATNSAAGVLGSYQYHALSGAQTQGNRYCLASITGAGTAATPDLVQCQMLPYETAGSTTVKVYALLDLPAYFPSANQGGTVTYGVAGTQWNPYSASTVNTA